MEKQLSPTEHNSLENRNKQQTNLVSKATTKCIASFCYIIATLRRYNILYIYFLSYVYMSAQYSVIRVGFTDLLKILLDAIHMQNISSA